MKPRAATHLLNAALLVAARAHGVPAAVDGVGVVHAAGAAGISAAAATRGADARELPAAVRRLHAAAICSTARCRDARTSLSLLSTPRPAMPSRSCGSADASASSTRCSAHW